MHTSPTLMAFWSRNRTECRPVGHLVAEARAGRLNGVEPLPSGYGFQVIDETAALAAMRLEPR